ncbi:uncharacterized protein PV09_03604 [Verruconis gallopava]|uniref:Coatomer subunit zeta n=1 Tax=Verruconis gallopava TaxID=253628 RepID=A0A0D2AFJ6_9PEZI|nr:uncharacterized protein PV09_03604 [Verruconis gallopava]KIW05748.1 hypothetical protein PV09_03604 [Verruconis gallopava]
MALSLHSIDAILILSTEDSSRIYAKYYSPPHVASGQTHKSPYSTPKEQKAFEKGLMEKTIKTNGDIILYDNRVVVYKTEGDTMLFVVGSADENEILLFNAVLALRDSLNILLKTSVDRRTIIENYDLVCLAIDELCDDGVLLETDPITIASRVSKPPPQDINVKGIDLSEQGLLNAWEFAKMKAAERIRQGI